MKLPKDLKTKKKKNIDGKKEQIYTTFKNTFIKLNSTHKPHYTVRFLKMGQTGKYSDMVYQTLGGYNNLDTNHFLLMGKEQNDIEFYINWVRLGKIFFKGKLFYDLERDEEFYTNLYEQIAHHEYGHTYLICSSSTMFYPNEALEYLEKKGYKNIKKIPEEEIATFKNISQNSRQHRINQTLDNVNFMDIANGVSECHANHTMRYLLKVDLPIEFLKHTKIDLLDGLHDYSTFDLNDLKKDYINRRINDWVIKANDLFIYDKLDTLRSTCEKYGFMPLLEFSHKINSRYLEIIQQNSELKDMKESILALAVDTNKLNFIELFFNT